MKLDTHARDEFMVGLRSGQAHVGGESGRDLAMAFPMLRFVVLFYEEPGQTRFRLVARSAVADVAQMAVPEGAWS